MGGGGHSSNTKTVYNVVNEDINNIHNNVKNIDNYMAEHNIVTDIQYGDRALAGSVKINDDVNAGTAYYKLMNLQGGLQNLHFLGDLSTGFGAASKLGGQVTGIAEQVAPGHRETGQAKQVFGLAGQIGDIAGQLSGQRIILLI